MSNTSYLSSQEVRNYWHSELKRLFGKDFMTKSVIIGTRKNGKNVLKRFSAVSSDNSIVAFVRNHSGYTKTEKKPNAKIGQAFEDCFFLNLVKSQKKLLVLTNKEFYDIFLSESEGLLGDVELIHLQYPPHIQVKIDYTIKKASDEPSY